MSSTSKINDRLNWDRFASTTYLLALAAVLGLNFLSRIGHDAQRINEVAFLALAGLGLVLGMSGAPAAFLGASPGGRSLALFFICGIASATMAYSPRYAGLEIALFLLLLALALAVADQVQRGGTPAMLVALQAVGCVGVLHAVRIIVNYIGSYVLSTQLEAQDFAPGFTNIRFFNHTQTVLLPLLVLLYCLTPATSRLRYLWLSLVSLWWATIFATTGRGSLLGLAAGAIFVVAVLRRSALPYLKALTLTLAGGIAIYVVFLVIVPTISGHGALGAFEQVVERSKSDPSSRRFFVWGNALELIRQHPWFGVGPMHFAHDAARFKWAAHPHDWVLQVAAEWGLPALLCLGFAVVQGLRALVRSRTGVSSIEGGGFALPALLASGAAVLVDGLVSGLIVMPQSQLAIALYLGFAIAWVRMAAPTALPAQAHGMATRLASVLLLLAALACLVHGAYPDIVDLMNDNPPGADMNRGLRWPRLWEFGFF
jgi:O-antigen ligase